MCLEAQCKMYVEIKSYPILEKEFQESNQHLFSRGLPGRRDS